MPVDLASPYDDQRFVFEEQVASQFVPKVRFVDFTSSSPKKQSNGLSASPNRGSTGPTGWHTLGKARRLNLRTFAALIISIAALSLAVAWRGTSTNAWKRVDFRNPLHQLSNLRAWSSNLRFWDSDARIPQNVQEYIQMAVHRALREELTGRDFALAIDGASVVLKLTSEHADNSAKVVLRDNLHGGNCWRLYGRQGQVGIRLLNPIRPTSVTIDHLPREATDDIDQAPRSMTLWGIVEGPTNTARYAELLATMDLNAQKDAPPIMAGYTFAALSRFEYDINSHRFVQTFPLDEHILRCGMTFAVFVLEVESNWGGSNTCIYRVRLHGNE